MTVGPDVSSQPQDIGMCHFHLCITGMLCTVVVYRCGCSSSLRFAAVDAPLVV